MTETVSTEGGTARSTRRGPNGRGQGLRLERVYTTPGLHPYDAVTWERRDVVMTNWRDGSINFEQRGVEFPDFWSVNAANIVTTKYFRGAVGSPTRESSLRQLIDRVVSVYRASGLENGYFASDEDAEISPTSSPGCCCTRCSASTRRCGSTWAPAARSRSRRASSWPSTTRWSRSSTGTARRA